MKHKGDIKINPKMEDEGLMFHFSPNTIDLIKIDKTSTAYRFSTHLIDSLLNKYKSHDGKIGLIGNDLNTIRILLALIMEGYDEYIHTAFLRDIIPHHCRPTYGNLSPEKTSEEETQE